MGRFKLLFVGLVISCELLPEESVGGESSGGDDGSDDVVDASASGPYEPDEPDQPGTTSVAEESEGGGESDSGDPIDPIDPIDPGACERLMECTAAAWIEFDWIVEMYGDNGTCWQVSTAEQCTTDCASYLPGLGVAYPYLPECRQCAVDADCQPWPDAPYCSPEGSCCSNPEGCEPQCGNAEIEMGEQCDGENLQGFDCESLGLDGGQLACDPVMCTFDTSGCAPGCNTLGGCPECGNAEIEFGEQCDGEDLQGFDCESLGLDGGQLACDPVMCTFDTSGCSLGCNDPAGCEPQCGNGAIEAGEQCDGDDLQGFDCESLGLDGGQLACDPAMCTFDTSGCTAGGV